MLAAFAVTVAQLGIPDEAIGRFLGSMAMDLDVASYPRWDDLLRYMDGSAAVIGEMMLPVLEPLDHAAAFQPARDLGLAFQLTNFLRDVGEDLERGRVYLPEEDLARFGADPWARTVTPEWRELMRFEIARARALYASADQGLPLLPPRSAACVRAARILYSRILVEIEGNDYDVFSTRARVSTGRKLATAAWCLGGHDRHEEAVGRPAGPVVHGVRPTEPAQPPPGQDRAAAGQPAVDAHVVDQQVQQSVAGDAGASRDQPLPAGRPPERHGGHRERGEHDGEPVVVLPATAPGTVVAAVPAPSRAVHDGTVGERGGRLAGGERHGGERSGLHGVVLVTARPSSDRQARARL